MVTHIKQDFSEQAMVFQEQKPMHSIKAKGASSSNSSVNKQKRSSIFGWFYDLPVRQKQLLGLFTSEIISIIGLMGVGALLIIVGGRRQLVQQAKAEEAVAEIAYNLKIDQMGFGFRGQSDNPGVIRAALQTANGQILSPQERAEIKSILKNETLARNIEYATLVDRNARIIVNANANRQGQLFDPDGLVSQVLENPQQLKASSIVTWEELQKESPEFPAGFVNSDALIRYTVTPIINPANNDAIGALVSGDIVNNKLPIVEKTLDAFDNGYGAIYMKNSAGELVLATSLDLGESRDMSLAKVNVGLPDSTLLNDAINSDDDTVVRRVNVGSQTYSASAKAIKNSQDQPIGVIVRGTSEAALNSLIVRSLQVQLLIAGFALAADTLLAIFLGRSIVTPINQLQNSTKRFALGNRSLRSEIQNKDEIGQLAKTFNDLADKITESEQKLMQEAQQQTIQAERAKFLAELAVKIRQTMKTEDIIQLCVDGAKEVLQVDRVLFFNFDEQWEGTVTAEAVEDGWPVKLGDSIHDPCFEEKYVQQYRQGRVQAISDIYQADLTDCYRQMMEPYKVRANLIVPVLIDNHLQSLLIAHQCEYPRQWTDGDIAFLQQISTQLGYALNQSQLFQQKEWARLAAEDLSEQQRRQKESLQMQLIDLLGDVEDAASGDLTVRADVTAGDIGTVADFFNSIIENLRQVVLQVKQSTALVNDSLENNEESMRELAQTALTQASDTTSTLASLKEMIQSIQVVAQQAQKAADVAHTASLTAETGGQAMDKTVYTIQGLRSTVGETAKKVKRLGEASQQISKVVSLINQIAMQTNLLAINAGIEAARAGEEGQGFAVVAEEVGELAARSAAATQEIEEIVNNIQVETYQVAEAMEMGTTQVVEGTQLVEEAKQSLNQIMTVSRQIDELVGSISAATVSQVNTSESVSNLMQQIAEVSEQTSQSSMNVSNSLQETVAIAQRLQESVDTFTVDELGESTMKQDVS
ncbi:MAG: methyl-accepting chemotaxis protein [Cyanobacteria bacterium P01_F01_bin.150]